MCLQLRFMYIGRLKRLAKWYLNGGFIYMLAIAVQGRFIGIESFRWTVNSVSGVEALKVLGTRCGNSRYVDVVSANKRIQVELQLNYTDLQKVSSTKFFGVIVDEYLPWKTQRWNFKIYHSKCACPQNSYML